MAEKDHQWSNFKSSYNMDHLVEPIVTLKNNNVFEEDKLVLTDSFDEACDELKGITVKKYKEL